MRQYSRVSFFLIKICSILLYACSPSDSKHTYTGYVEAEYVYAAAPQSGWLMSVLHREGDHVTKGALLFELDSDLQQAEREEAQAQLKQAEANLRLAQAELTRNEPLLKRQAISQARFDDIKTQFERAQADEQNARARISKAKYQLTQRQRSSHWDATIEEVFFRTGEFVTAGSPIFALLPHGNLKVRFFLPQEDLVRVTPGTLVEVYADGLAESVDATINFIAREAEFTPPVLYTEGQRDKLVFLVEAAVPVSSHLRAGLPVDVVVP